MNAGFDTDGYRLPEKGIFINIVFDRFIQEQIRVTTSLSFAQRASKCSVLSVVAVDLGHVLRALDLAQRLINNLNALVHLALSDHQRRGETDDRLVSGLGQQTVLLERNAHVPSSARVFGVHFNGAEQTAAAHRLDERELFLELAQHAHQLVAHLFSLLDELLLLDHLQGCNAHSRGERIASVSASVLACD